MNHRLLLGIALIMMSAVGMQAQSVIQLHEEPDGRYTMNASVNGVGVRTYYAPENWYASMSTTTYLFLYENGYIAPADVNGMTTTKMPDGSTVKAASFVIRNLKIGRVIVQNLPAFVITKQNVPLIVGNAAFDCFGTISQEGERLIIDDRFEEDFAQEEETAEAPAEDPAIALERTLQQHMDAKEYADAANCFAQLQEMGVPPVAVSC